MCVTMRHQIMEHVMKRQKLISSDCFDLIKSRAILPFEPIDSIKLSSGNWLISFEEETIERVEGKMLPNETFSDAIFRIVSSKN